MHKLLSRISMRICQFFWSRAYDILLDAALLGFALTYFLPHLQNVYNTRQLEKPFFQGIIDIYCKDIREFPLVYVIFAGIVALWLLLKIPKWVHETRLERHSEQDNERRHIELRQDIQNQTDAIQNLINEIREDRNERNNSE
jgi:hypothetical protein